VQFVDIVRDPATKTPAIIEEYVKCPNPARVWMELKPEEVKMFTFEFLRTLDFIHSKGIIFRDVKPHNALIDRELKQLKLVDFGQAEFYIEGKELNTRVSAINFKAPEILLGYPLYDFAIDMWSFGALFASIIFRKNPFFGGRDTMDQLSKIAKIMGSQDILEMISEK
jgi:casein kinase II subunit alpha